MATSKPSSLSFDSHIKETDPEFLRIVRDEKEFCKNTYYWGLLSYRESFAAMANADSTTDFLVNGIQTKMTTNTNDPFTPLAVSEIKDRTAILKVVDKFLEYFNTPIKIIKCSDPDEYLYGIKSICDGIFTYLVEKRGLTSNMYKFNVLVMEFITQLNNRLPFNDDDDSLSTFMVYVSSFLSSDFQPKQFQTDLKLARPLIYAAYYPFFVFMYILTYIPTQEKKNRLNLTFRDTRKARLACYLFVAHMSFILNKLLNAYIENLPQSEKAQWTPKTTLLQQILGNVSLNILGKESNQYDADKKKNSEYLEKLSKENISLNKQILEDNERYERYKQNLISAANNEKSIDNQLASASKWLKVHLWLFVSFIIIATIILIIPKGKIPNSYDVLLLQIVCATALLYTSIRGVIGAVRMFKNSK